MGCIRQFVTTISPIVVALLVSACGGGETGDTAAAATGAQISLSLSPATATVQESSTANLTATATADTRNLGVTWAVRCQASTCGTVTPSKTANGAPVLYTAPATMHSGTAVTVTVTSVSDRSKSVSATPIPVVTVARYGVGVDYHSNGPDFDQTTFISTYDQPQVRSKPGGCNSGRHMSERLAE